MIAFLSTNWIWILLVGGMLYMHLGHRGHGCGRGTPTAPPDQRQLSKNDRSVHDAPSNH